MKKIIPVVVGLSLTPALFALEQPTSTPSTQPASAEKHVTPSGLTIVTVSRGEGARVGDMVWVNYEGRLTDGTKFDSSFDRQEPTPIALGQGTVIRGWEEGLLGMQVGEKRQLIIPPNLAFGPQGRGKIPPNATLVFDVEMVGIRRN